MNLQQGFFLWEVYDLAVFLIEEFRLKVIRWLIEVSKWCRNGFKALGFVQNFVEDIEISSVKDTSRKIQACLSNSSLSFYDQFHCICGVPAFVFTQNQTPVDSKEANSSSYQNTSDSVEQPRLTHGLRGDERYIQTLTEDAKSVVVQCSFSNDGSRLVVCFSCGEVMVWDTDHGTFLKSNYKLQNLSVCSVSFREDSNSVVLAATTNGICLTWDLTLDTCHELNISRHWEEEYAEMKGEPIPQTASFLCNGTYVIFSVYVIADSFTSTRFVLFETSSLPLEPKVKTLNVTKKKSAGRFQETDDDVVTQMVMSPNHKRLIVGFSDSQVENGYCVLWPNVVETPNLYHRLEKGTLGSWSSNSDLFVTWTVPDDPFPEKTDGSCAFIWNAQKFEQKLNHSERQHQNLELWKELRNPYGKNVLWCQFVQSMEGKEHLAMCVIRTTARFILWDVELQIMTHIIGTDISSRDMILDDRNSWRQLWVGRKPLKGLSPLATNMDMTRLGAVSGYENRVLIIDALLGTQILNITPPNSAAHYFQGELDIIFSPTKDKFAIINDAYIVVFAPPSSHHWEQKDNNLLPSQALCLRRDCDECKDNSEFKMLFSGDGNTLGVLTIGSSRMQVFHLMEAFQQEIPERALPHESIADFCLSQTGKYLVICLTKSELQIILCEEQKEQIVATVPIPSIPLAIGIKEDGSEVIVCLSNGSLVWYNNAAEAERSITDREFLMCSSVSSHDVLEQSDIQRSRKSVIGPSSARLVDKQQSRSLLPLSETFAAGITRFGRRRSPPQKYVEIEQTQSENVQSCQISPRCEKALQMLTTGEARIWDLQRKTVVSTTTINACSKPIPCSDTLNSLSGYNSTLSRIESDQDIFRKTNFDFSGGSDFVLTENQNVVLVTTCSSLIPEPQTPPEVHVPLPTRNESLDMDYIYVINVQDLENIKELRRPKLMPHKGLVISPDGRHIACFSEKYASNVIVWNCYATQGLLPDYQSLSLLYKLRDKDTVLENIPPLLSTFGTNLVSCVHGCGYSLLHQAILHRNNHLLKMLLKCALKRDSKVSFWMSKPCEKSCQKREYENGVKRLILTRSPELIKTIIKYLLKRVSHEADVASILENSLIELHITYPRISLHTLHHPDLFSTITEVKIPDTVHTHDAFCSKVYQSLHLAYSEAKHELWNSKGENSSDDLSQVRINAIAKVLPYHNACNIGSDGLLRHFLINRSPYSTFATFLMEAIVDYKWTRYARLYVLSEIVHHCLLLIIFTIYSFLLCDQGTYKIPNSYGDEEDHLGTKITLYISMALVVPSLVRELQQCVMYTTYHGIRGFFYWLSSAWNWIEVLSYLNIVFIIPFSQFHYFNTGNSTIKLSSFVAIESLLLWSRMLFYARPFKSTGPLVIVISSIVEDIIPFLSLALCVMFGFAVAFHVLYRHISNGDCENDDVCESMYFSFGTFPRTFATIFAMVFGDFNLQDLYKAPEPATAIVLFLLYMVIIAIILLNMLIAIMGHSFSRVLSNKDSRFIKARALAIDDIDSMLSARTNRHLRKQLHGYLHVAIPTYVHDKVILKQRRAKVLKEKQKKTQEAASSKDRRSGSRLQSFIRSELSAKQSIQSFSEFQSPAIDVIPEDQLPSQDMVAGPFFFPEAQGEDPLDYNRRSGEYGDSIDYASSDSSSCLSDLMDY